MKKFTCPKIGMVKVEDEFLRPRIENNAAVTIPASLKFCHKTGRIDAFRLKWRKGKPNMPHVFWDSDVAKVLEGMAYSLMLKPDTAMEKQLEKLVELVTSSQQPDGYLNSHFTVVEPQNRWKNLYNDHELYCAGHLIEAAVAHFTATGRRTFIDVAEKLADYIDSVFGRGKGQIRGYPGHEEIELALCRLAEVTGKRKYLKKAKYFIDERGTSPNYFSRAEGVNKPWALIARQADRPVRQQNEAYGHAVRAVYLYCGMADVAAATGDEELLNVCEKLFDSITMRKMYITGGIGSTWDNEAIERDYLLPNDLCYAESCASIGLVFFASRMHQITGKAKYLDVIERALFNGILAGISLSGDAFFYKNPLKMSATSRYEHERQQWFDCSCCPTNFCRFLPQIGSLVWSYNSSEVRLCMPVASTFDNGDVALRLRGGYPYDGTSTIEILRGGEFTLSLRIPSWSRKFKVIVESSKPITKANDGFVSINRVWKTGDKISIELDMPVQIIRSNHNVDANAGLAALQRGPLVYALESIDNLDDLNAVLIDTSRPFLLKKVRSLPAGTLAITGSSYHETFSDNSSLYVSEEPSYKEHRFLAIPYCLWQNRGYANMSVWNRVYAPKKRSRSR